MLRLASIFLQSSQQPFAGMEGCRSLLTGGGGVAQPWALGFSTTNRRGGGTFDDFSPNLLPPRPKERGSSLQLTQVPSGRGRAQTQNPLTAKATSFPSIVWRWLREGREALDSQWAQSSGKIWGASRRTASKLGQIRATRLHCPCVLSRRPWALKEVCDVSLGLEHSGGVCFLCWVSNLAGCLHLWNGMLSNSPKQA